MISVRTADPRDRDARALLEASHALMASLYPAEHNHYLSIEALCVPEISFFVATRDGLAQGCGALFNKASYGEVKSMFVAPAARGSGLAAAILDRIEAEARAMSLPMLRLETGDTLDAAHRLYTRKGFEICGKFGDYQDGPHSIFMQKPLA